ncbi:MAG: ATP-binding cassette domain-containing protein [Elusimicrobiota bacterium]|nr:ATP-binding cassette domain-containing protein [Elusimicrobiota bacterium]
MKLLIKAENIWLENSRSVVFKNVRTEIKKGDFVWIEGAGASGKSLLMRTLAKKIKPSKGKLLSYTKTPLCAPDGSLLENESVKNNIREMLRRRKENDTAFIMTELMKSMDLFDVRNIAAGKLSDSQRQLLNLSTFLVLETEALLFDDPLAALDNEHRILFIAAAEKKRNRGTAIVISSTLPCPAACPAGARHILLKDGKLSEE